MMAKGQPELPPLPAEPPAKEDPSVQARAGEERLRLKARRGRQSTILTRGVLTGPEDASTSTLLGGGRAA